ncbi:MAG: ATP-binding protein [Oscillospiraceae bacterium]|nr:ATP-binding protein [Oscillospiraceae bacterium]
MKRLDFAAAMDVLKQNTPKHIYKSQPEFLEELFEDAIFGYQKDVDMDHGRVSKRINGLQALNKELVIYYEEKANRDKLVKRINERLVTKVPDKYMVVRDLQELVVQADNVSPQRKAELLGNGSFKSDEDMAEFVADVLCISMQLPFSKRDVRKSADLSEKENSFRIFDTEVPKPCPCFSGRERELEQLHALLSDNSKVFVHGIPGIGKSELVKAYAQKYKKEYTNIIYVNCSKGLKDAVTAMKFTTDLPGQSETERFERHNDFLRTLLSDTLLIMDNCNVAEGEDGFLTEMLEYPCKIVFTTRNRYEKHTMLEVAELEEGALFDLAGEFFARMEEHREEVEAIVTLLHRHTFVVERMARLLVKGLTEPDELPAELQQANGTLDAADKSGAEKDGKTKKAACYTDRSLAMTA